MAISQVDKGVLHFTCPTLDNRGKGTHCELCLAGANDSSAIFKMNREMNMIQCVIDGSSTIAPLKERINERIK